MTKNLAMCSTLWLLYVCFFWGLASSNWVIGIDIYIYIYAYVFLALSGGTSLENRDVFSMSWSVISVDAQMHSPSSNGKNCTFPTIELWLMILMFVANKFHKVSWVSWWFTVQAFPICLAKTSPAAIEQEASPKPGTQRVKNSKSVLAEVS